mgnify:CR=1 FL=1
MNINLYHIYINLLNLVIMKNLTIILSFILCSNCFAGNKASKKMNSEKLCYHDYIDQYGINDTSKANPIANPTATTMYTLTVLDSANL